MTARVDPFVGLAPYGEQDAEWFFGREREVELIVANLRAARLTLLYGSSGVGKSSVLLAGALPRLRAIQDADREDAHALAARGGAALAERPSLAVAIVRDWGEVPLPRLAAAIHAAVVDATGNHEIEPWDGEEPFADRLREYAREVRTILVVLDQFEEYFMYHPDEDGPGTLAGELPELLDDIDLRVNFLLGMREDALFRLDRFKGRIPDLFGNYLRLDYLERDAARGAIKKPVDHYNATVRAGRPPVEVDDTVVEEVLDGVRAGRLALHGSADRSPGAAAGTRVETPYLQLVMRQLWAAGTAGGGHEVTLRTLERLGGAGAIVSNHLGQAMGQLSESDQAVAADVFRYLVTPSRTKIAHAAEDLAGFSGRPLEDVARVLRDLANSDRRVLRAVPGTSKGDPVRYELYHDVLAEAVHEWASRNQERRSVLRARRERLRRWRRRGLIGFAWLVCAGLAINFVPRLGGGGRTSARARRPPRSSPTSRRCLSSRTPSAPSCSPARPTIVRRARRRPPCARPSPRRACGLRTGEREPRPCGTACAGMGRRGKPKPVAVSMYARRSDRYYDHVGYTAGQMDGGRWMAVAPSGRTVAVVRNGQGRAMGAAAAEPARATRSRASMTSRRSRSSARAGGCCWSRRRMPFSWPTAGASSRSRGERPWRRHPPADATSRPRTTRASSGCWTSGPASGGALDAGRRVTSLAFNPSDAQQLAVGVRDAEGIGVKLIDWRSGDGPRLKAGAPWLGDAEGRFNGNGRRILVTTGGARPKVLDVDTQRASPARRRSSAPPRACAGSARGWPAPRATS